MATEPTIPLLGDKGGRIDLLVKQASTLRPKYCRMKRGDGSPIDITGCLFLSELRKTADAPAMAARVKFVITDAPNGRFYYYVDDASTTGILADPEDERQPESIYVWDSKIKFPGVDGEAWPLFYGNVYVFRTSSHGVPE